MEPKLYRSLIRIIARDDNEGYTDNGAWCVIPGWSSNVAVHIPAAVFGDFWKYALPQTRLFAQATIGVELQNIHEFAIAGPFEFAPEPDPTDGLE